ncbi:MAG: polysaccharide deacetylase family protein [Lachnospiraceae bacterium]
MEQKRRIVMFLVLLMTAVFLIMNIAVLATSMKSKSEARRQQATVKADDATNTSTTGSTDQTSATTEETTVRTIDPNRPVVAFTFDDGPYSAVTDKIVADFEQYNGRCTFFVVANRLGNGYEDYQASLKNAYDKGNEIGTHTFDHYDLTNLEEQEIIEEIKKSSDRIEKVIGAKPTLLRPPYGSLNEKVKKCSELPLINWNIDSQDWKDRDPEKICDTVMKLIENESIVLMHDLYETTEEALQLLLPKLQEEGYQFVTVSELYEYKGIELEKGGSYGIPVN